MRERKECVAVLVNNGVPRATCFDAAAYVLSEFSHGQAVGDGHGDTPAFRCEENSRPAL